MARKTYAEQLNEAWAKIDQLKRDYNDLKEGRRVISDPLTIRNVHPIYKVRVNDTTFHVQSRSDAEFLMLCLKQALPLSKVDIHKLEDINDSSCYCWVKVA